MAFTDKDRERAIRTEEKVDSLTTSRNDHEQRLRKLEKGRNVERSILTSIAAFLTYLGTHLFK